MEPLGGSKKITGDPRRNGDSDDLVYRNTSSNFGLSGSNATDGD